MTTYFAGIDPGLSGAVAVLRITPGAQRPWLEKAWALPVFHTLIGGKERRRYDLLGVSNLIASIGVYEPAMVAIEDVQGRGGQVGSSAMGYGVGALHMACEIHKLPVVHRVSPTVWKGALRCPASKPRTAAMAKVMIDNLEEQIRGPRGGLLDGHAEAALVAYWAWTRFGRR